MKHIDIELSKDGCDKVIKELEKYQKETEPKLMEVCRRLAEIGINEAMTHLKLENFNTDAHIEQTPVQITNGYKIVMSGSDVYFVEFGTGDNVEAYTPNVSVLVAPGSWSETHAKKYMVYGYWYFDGVKFEGTEAYKPMYYAAKAIRENADRVMKEVFGKT